MVRSSADRAADIEAGPKVGAWGGLKESNKNNWNVMK